MIFQTVFRGSSTRDWSQLLNKMLMGGRPQLPVLLIMSLGLLTCSHANGQPYYCGHKIQGPITGTPKYLDRFGNQYGQADITTSPNTQQAPCAVAGDFDVRFVVRQFGGVDYPFSDEEMTTICAVFEYVSGLIVAPSGRRAIVELSKNPLLSEDGNTAARGTSYFLDKCGMGHSLVHRILNSKALFPHHTRHAEIEINPLAPFYTGLGATPPNQLDLCTAILHETLHTLGFASQIGPSGDPVQGFYTLWDLNLRNANNNFMINSGPSQNNCCRHYSLNTPVFSGLPGLIWNQNCGDLVFDVAEAPTVNAHYGTQGQAEFLNTLSHLDDDCGDEYVMNYELLPGQARRTMTAAEIAILCRLGYTAPNNCSSACFVLTTDDGPFIRSADLTQNGFPYTLTYDMFLHNDVRSSDTEIAFPPNCLDNGLFTIVNDPSTQTTTINFKGPVTRGHFRLCYTLSGCDGRVCDQGVIALVVGDNAVDLAYDCPNSDCNLICNGDFEAFFPRESFFHFNAGIPTWESGDTLPAINDSYDVWYMPETNNQVVAGISYDGGEEAFAYPLRRPIPPNCSATFSFMSAAVNRNQNWRVLGFNQLPPCADIQLPNGCAGTTYNDPVCSGLSGICIQNIPAADIGTAPEFNPYFIAWGDPAYPFATDRGPVAAMDAAGFDFQPVSFTWTNNSTIPINYIVIDYPAANSSALYTYNYIDDLVIELAPTCSNHVTITPTVQAACVGGTAIIDFEVCLTGPFSAPSDVRLTVPLDPLSGITYGSGGDFVNGAADISGLAVGDCVTRRLTLNLPAFLAVGQTLAFDMAAAITGACWDNHGDDTFEITTGDCCHESFSADFTLSANCNTVTFAGTPSNAGLTHAWDFDGNGTIDSNEPNPTYTYPNNGYYTVVHTVANLCGAIATSQQDIALPAAPCQSLCRCPVGAGSINLGTLKNSVTRLSTAGLPAQISNHCISVLGTLVVDIPEWSVSTSEFIMNEASEIVVEPGNRLILTGNNIHGCDKMWKGIRVESAFINAYNNKPVADAQYGIRLLGTSTRASIEFNRFDADFTGIRADLPLAGTQLSDINIHNNTFTCSRNLLPPYVEKIGQFPHPGTRTFAGVILNGVPTAFLEGNTIQHTRNGIMALNSTFNLSNLNWISDLVDVSTAGGNLGAGIFRLNNYGVYLSGCELATIDECILTNLRKGIFATQSGLTTTNSIVQALVGPSATYGKPVAIESKNGWPGRTIDIRYNVEMESVGDGIVIDEVLASQEMQVAANYITLYPQADDGIRATNCQAGTINNNVVTGAYGASFKHGIRLENLTDCDIVSNLVWDAPKQGIKTTHGGNDYFLANWVNSAEEDGFYVENNGGLEAFCQNYTEGGDYGFRFAGQAASDFRCSQIGNSGEHGLFLGVSDPALPQVTTVIGEQEHAVNIWAGCDAFHSGMDEPVILRSQFKTDPAVTPVWNTAIGQSVGWFFELGGPTECEPVCKAVRYPLSGNTATAPNTTVVASRLMGAAEIGAATGDYEDPAFAWMAQQALYERLEREPARANDHPAIAAFYASAPQTPVGKLYEVKRKTRLLLERDSTAQAARRTWREAFLSANTAALILKQSEAPDSVVVSKLTEAASYRHQLAQWDAGVAAQMDAEGQILLAENAAIPAPNLCAQNEKDFNALFLAHRLWKEGETPVGALDTLKAIADQCPFTGGFAVYEARALYRRLVPDTEWNDAMACQVEGQERSPKQPIPSFGFSVSPNPATSELTVGRPQKEAPEGRFELYDTRGRLALAQTLPTGETATLVSVSHLPAGLYYYAILSGTSVVYRGKSVIQH